MPIDPVTAIAEGVKLVIQRVWPDPTDQAKAQLELLQLQQTGELARLAAETDLAKGQLEINKAEAQSGNLWVSGARPFFMWVCGTAFAYHFVLQPLLAFLLAAAGHSVVLPAFDIDALMTVAMGMLGLGAFRTVEKIKKAN